ncbi:MAG: hypothetical protein WDN46_15990 [Methylocella sp.]
MTLSAPVLHQRPSLARRISAALWRNSTLGLWAVLGPPFTWFVLIYLAALVALFVTAFWSVDDLTAK